MARNRTADVLCEVESERIRQIELEGFDAAHDDEHKTGEIALAAACYVLYRSPVMCSVTDYWPWDPECWKPKNPRRDLIRAMALLVAEIERLDRASPEPQPVKLP